MRKVLSNYIYVINSHINDCLLISRTLHQIGFEVGYETDARKGFATVMAAPPQCLILDSILPGINGYAILRQVRAAYPQPTLPIIITSAKHSEIDRNYTLGLGADGYIDKPFTPQQLLQAVWNVLPLSARNEAMAHHITRTPSARRRPMLPNIRTLIPCRSERPADVLRGSNLSSNNADIADAQLRRLYAAIDNQRSVHTLSAMMQLNPRILFSILEKLWDQHYIVFYDAEQEPRKPIDFARIRAYALEDM